MIRDLVPPKRDLGVIYLIGVGFVFTVVVFREAFGVSSPSLEQLLSLTAGFLLAVGLIAVGYWLLQSPLGDERVLVVAEWGALGMALPTTIVVVGMIFLPLGPTPGLLVTVIGAGGIVGSLVGSVKALEDEHRNLNHLYRRNKVLQRVLRHNIRNGMTVVQGYADLLEEDLDGAKVDMVKTINREAGSIVDLSEMARNLDSLESANYRRPMDVSAIIDELIDGLLRNYPEATLETAVPRDVYVLANNFIELALWETLEYAIRNADGQPIRIEVDDDAGGRVAIDIGHDGNPISTDALQALERGSETQLQHLDGMELWVAKWLIENVDGTIDFDAEGSFETTIRMSLDAAGSVEAERPDSIESYVSPG